jgi:hypothetical protein
MLESVEQPFFRKLVVTHLSICYDLMFITESILPLNPVLSHSDVVHILT